MPGTQHQKLEQQVIEHFQKKRYRITRPSGLLKGTGFKPDVIMVKHNGFYYPDFERPPTKVKIIWGEIVVTNFNGFPAPERVKIAMQQSLSLFDIFGEKAKEHFSYRMVGFKVPGTFFQEVGRYVKDIIIKFILVTKSAIWNCVFVKHCYSY